ncbi:MAG: hypothetical protein II896_02530 [Clostridia bacterium]|nr:hypothetical protein [Clostridia bacterium]
MDILWYDDDKMPAKIRLISKGLQCATVAEAPYDDKPFTEMKVVFALAMSQCFEDVSVYFTEENHAILINGKTREQTPVVGWVSLLNVADGRSFAMFPPVQC